MRKEQTFELNWQFFKNGIKEGMLGYFRPFIWSWQWLRRHGCSKFTAALAMFAAFVVLTMVTAHFQPQINAAAGYLDKLPDPAPYFWWLFWFMMTFGLVSLVGLSLLALIANALKDD